MKTHLFILLFLILSSTSYSQTATIRVDLPANLSQKLSQGHTDQLTERLTRAVMSPSGDLYMVNTSGETIRFNLVNGQKEALSVSKAGFDQAAPILMNAPSESSVMAIIPKLFTDPNDDPKGLLRKVGMDGTVTDLYQTQSGWIRSAGVSEEGHLIGLIIADAEGVSRSEDQVLVIDRFGNELDVFSLGMETRGVTFTASLSHVILYSQNRVGVFDLKNGERVAGTSIRSGILYATFIPEDNTILAVGTESVTLVHIEQRKIATSAIPSYGQLDDLQKEVMESGIIYQAVTQDYLSDQFIPIYEPVRLLRKSDGEYECSGFFGRTLHISGRF